MIHRMQTQFNTFMFLIVIILCVSLFGNSNFANLSSIPSSDHEIQDFSMEEAEISVPVLHVVDNINYVQEVVGIATFSACLTENVSRFNNGRHALSLLLFVLVSFVLICLAGRIETIWILLYSTYDQDLVKLQHQKDGKKRDNSFVLV